MELVEGLHALAPLLAELDDRDRDHRFGPEMPQAQIGEHLDTSQMHVSRRLKRLLTQLREAMLTQN